jgi:hypothetical protein
MKTKARRAKEIVPAETEALPGDVAEQQPPAEVRLPQMEQRKPGPGLKERLGSLAADIGQIKPEEPPPRVRPARSYARPSASFD